MLGVQVVLLALAVSADSFAVGAAYGFRKVRMPVGMIALVAGISAFAKAAAMLFGGMMVLWINAQVAQRLGAIILLALAVWQFRWAAGGVESQGGDQTLSASEKQGVEDASTDSLLTLRLRPLGIIVNVLRDPEVVDIDNSKSISAVEAVLLGLALGMDAMGAGVGAGLLGMPVFLTMVAVGLGTLVTLPLGVWIGSAAGDRLPRWPSRILPGTTLLILAILVWLTG